jgi:3-hydroxyacyl-CoA dehydrogenase / 3-hydroxy-2-methylbutyryl-CoA dehydrogenase
LVYDPGKGKEVDMNVKDCVAVVTGGASGLGEETARNLINNGAKVAILDFAEERGEQVAKELGSNALFIKADVTTEEDVEKAMEKIVKQFGTIHIVVNCAGVVDPGKVFSRGKPLPLANFNRVISINLVGTFNVVRLAVPYMINNFPQEDGERGVIINTASVAAFEGQIGQPAYSASKAGVVGMTLPLARELAEYSIRVMAVAPGIFNTPMLAGLPEAARESLSKMSPFPKRMGEPVDFAILIRHIIENRMLNGEVIRLDAAIRMAAK